MDADGVIRTDLALCSDPASPGGSDLEDPTAVPCGEEQTVPSILPEIIADGTDTNSIGVGAGDPNGVSSASTPAVPSRSGSPCPTESCRAGGCHDDGDPEGPLPTSDSAAPVRGSPPSPPDDPADRSLEDGGSQAREVCNAACSIPLQHLLPSCQDYRDRNNMVKRLTPDFSEREGFFDLVWEVQSRRLNDQRCSFRRSRDRRPYRSLPSSPLDRENPFFASMSSLQTEEFFDLIACSQSRRLNDQRADFEESPTVALCAPFPTGPVEYLAPLGSMASQTQSAVSPPAAPAEGEETPAEGRERPTEAEEQPAEHEQNPVGRERLPTEGGQAPAERQEIPAEGEVDPGELQEIPAEGEEAPVYKAMYQVQMSTGTKGPDDELYNIILSHQSASARIEDQRCDPPAYSSQALFDLLQRLQEQRMDEQRAPLPPGLAPKRVSPRAQEDRRPSIFTPLLKGMSQRRANSS